MPELSSTKPKNPTDLCSPLKEALTQDPRIKTRLSRSPLPRDWSTLPGGHELVFSSDVLVSPDSTLCAKVTVFEDYQALCRFWTKALGRDKPTPETRAITSELDFMVRPFDASAGERDLVREVDPTYFAAMGFILDSINVEFIAHECTHAAIAYHRRVGKRKTWPDAHDFPEEAICYPVGKMAGHINSLFYTEGIYARSLVRIL